MKTIILAILCLIAPVAASRGDVTFSDETFSSSDWELIVLPDGNGGTTSAAQQTNGGNIGPYRVVHTSVIQDNNHYTGIWGFHRRNGATYDPRVQGGIAWIDYAEDSIQISPADEGQATGPALRQAGKIFIHFVTVPTAGRWTHHGATNLVAADFVHIDPSLPFFSDDALPDVSTNGQVIEFGFYRANSTPAGLPGYSRDAGIDNWTLTVRTYPPALVFTDWTSLDLTNNIASGTLDGVVVTFSGDTNLGYSTINGSSMAFASTKFSPPLATSDAIYFACTTDARTYSIVFAGPIRDPIIHLQSLASTLTLWRATPTKLSGDSTLVVTGATVSGIVATPDGNDSDGSIQLAGVYCSISFSGRYTNTIDGIRLQIGGTAIRRPWLGVSRAADLVELTFSTDTGIAYQVQYSPVLPTTNWANLGPPIAGDGTMKTTSDAIGAFQTRFYRVQVLVCL